MVRPSLLLSGVFALAGLTALGVAWVIPIPAAWALVAALSILLATLHAVLKYGRLATADAIIGVEVNLHGELRCLTRGSGWQMAELLPSSSVTPWLVALNLKTPGRRLATHLLLTVDSAAPEPLRQLRVWLRWGRHGQQNDRPRLPR